MDYSLPGYLSMEFSRQEYWSGLLFPSPKDLPHPGIKPRSLALQADSLEFELPGSPFLYLKRACCLPIRELNSCLSQYRWGYTHHYTKEVGDLITRQETRHQCYTQTNSITNYQSSHLFFWDSPGKNTGVPFPLQVIFLIQESNLHLLH